MILLRFEQILISLRGGVIVDAGFEREEESADMVEAVQLVEDGNVVDLANSAFF
jgi:hypothetical protein